MAERDYVRQYFTENADAWIAGAYVDAEVAPKYPLGNERVSFALHAVLDRLGALRGRLLDLGCGGGQLCFEAAHAGMHATGVDAAEGMFETCQVHTRGLPPEQAKRLTFRVGDVVNTGLPSGEFDAVTALGLIEYVPEDPPFLAEVFRLLRPGGVFVVTCRNRLFNLASQNQYTRREFTDRSAERLLDELLGTVGTGITPETLHTWLRSLKAAIPALEEAIQRDLAVAGDASQKPGTAFGQSLRQHTPSEIESAARRTGFVQPDIVGIHPHPFPPAYEHIAPNFFNTLARTFSCFATKRASLAWCSCFQVTFTKGGD